jgi:organic radical activating enzyme
MFFYKWIRIMVKILSPKRVIKKIEKVINNKLGRLNLLQIVLTGHCNLNCKSCGAFCPVATEWYASIEEYNQDLQQLRRILPYIRVICLTGGETLLHPNIDSIIKSTRLFYKESHIIIQTNGILLSKMSAQFWNACRTAKIKINITVYPPFLNNYKQWIELCKENDIPVFYQKTFGFYRNIDFSGKSDIAKNSRTCSFKEFPHLINGKIYKCSFVVNCKNLNSRFGLSIPDPYSTDIYQTKSTRQEIIQKLNKAIDTCAYCSFNNKVRYGWDFSEQKMEEWDAYNFEK